MGEKDRAAGFETHRRYLTGLAYRMLGSMSEAQDAVQDAYLAAVAAHVAQRLRIRVPTWAEKKCRRLEHPWFALPDAWARATLLRDSPAAFRERNLFTTEDALHRA